MNEWEECLQREAEQQARLEKEAEQWANYIEQRFQKYVAQLVEEAELSEELTGDDWEYDYPY